MSFSGYPVYKDSGIEWLGEVPSHWIVQRLKNSVGAARNGLWGEEAQGDENDIICVRVADFDRKTFRVTLANPTMRSVAPKEREGRLLCKSDLLLEKSGGGEKQPVGTVVVYDHDDPAVCSNFVARVVLAPNMHSRFWCYVHAASYAIRLTVGSINQTSGIQNLDQSRYFDEQAPFPPYDEQAAIATFLDCETAKIDALVEEQRRLIALLKEKRQAVISHAVTKGLNPDAAMKDSGIEWLGEVPAHWMVTAAGRYLQILSGFAFPSEGFSTDLGHTRLLRGVNVGVGRVRWDETVYWPRLPGDRLSSFELSEGELVIGMDRPWIAEGVRIAKLSKSDLPCLLLQRVAALRPADKLDVDYLQLLLSSPAFVDYFTPDMTGVSVPHLSPGQISAFPIPLPPPAEQRAIVAHVQLRAAQADQLIAAAEEATELLGERRSALISAAVTGKIDVRSPANVVPFPVDRVRARGLIAAEIIERSAHQGTFGRVKLQKIAYLAEAHAGVTELDGVFQREAAGPLDRDMIREMEREAGALAGVRVEQPDGKGSAVAYRLGDRRGAHRQDLVALLGDRTGKFDKLVDDIGTIDTKGAEAVATLYAIWNDALIDGERPEDMEIKLAVLSEWHPEKAQKFRIDELQIWLDWMRRHGLVPTGAGPKTSTGRLFA